MNSKDTVLAVMKDAQGLREHDRKTGQDARWQGLDKVPDTALHALRMHGGRLTHKVIHYKFSTRTSESGITLNVINAAIRFNVFGRDKGDPVGGTVIAVAAERGDNAAATVYKRALRTFLVGLLELPNDRAARDFPSYENGDSGVRTPRTPKAKASHNSRVTDIPWSPRTEALGARIAELTLDEYAVEWARYYMDAQATLGLPISRPYIMSLLQSEGFSWLQAKHGAYQALLGEEVVA